MIYPNDNPLVGGHVADNRLASANISSHYEFIDDQYVPVIDTVLNASKRDNYLNNTQKDYSMSGYAMKIGNLFWPYTISGNYFIPTSSMPLKTIPIKYTVSRTYTLPLNVTLANHHTYGLGYTVENTHFFFPFYDSHVTDATLDDMDILAIDPGEIQVEFVTNVVMDENSETYTNRTHYIDVTITPTDGTSEATHSTCQIMPSRCWNVEYYPSSHYGEEGYFIGTPTTKVDVDLSTGIKIEGALVTLSPLDSQAANRVESIDSYYEHGGGTTFELGHLISIVRTRYGAAGITQFLRLPHKLVNRADFEMDKYGVYSNDTFHQRTAGEYYVCNNTNVSVIEFKLGTLYT